MEKHHEIKIQIQNKYNLLPKNQQKIADFFINNFNRIPFLNVQEISSATTASVASIVRFAQRTGFTGFSELREAIAESLQSRISKKEIFPLFEKKKIDKDLLTSVANLDIKNINETLSLIERNSFNQTIDLVLKSKRVFTAGLGISYLLAEILSYQLKQVAVDAYSFNHSTSVFHEQILFLKPDDLFIVFSFPPYSKETIESAKLAKERNIKVIAITNKEASPVTFHSFLNLVVKSENMLYTNSFAAISVLINAIATACALKNEKRAKQILDESNKITNDDEQFIK